MSSANYQRLQDQEESIARMRERQYLREYANRNRRSNTFNALTKDVPRKRKKKNLETLYPARKTRIKKIFKTNYFKNINKTNNKYLNYITYLVNYLNRSNKIKLNKFKNF